MIPTIDLQAPDLAALDQACCAWGFFALENHGIPQPLIDASLGATQRFFEQDAAAKQTIARSGSNSWGYNDAELTKNKRDHKEILDIGPPVSEGPLAGSQPQWPSLPGFQTTIEALQRHLHATALTVARLVTASLAAEIDVAGPFRNHSSFLRLNYYPHSEDPAIDETALTAPHGDLGISHHTDAGAVTVLLQDGLAGLEVYNADRWVAVPGTRGGVIINIGDIVQVWSNDRYKAPIHRVRASTGEPRMSIPYFLNPAYEYNYAPLTAEAPRYQPINWGEFRSKRSAGDYADVGSEIQISDYRTA